MSEPPDPSDFSNASHAYEHAEHASDHPVHRVDVTDAPRWPPDQPRPRPADAPRPPERNVTHTHRVEAPTRAGFKLGFGFALGVGTFRALVLIVMWTMLAIVIGSLLMRAFPS